MSEFDENINGSIEEDVNTDKIDNSCEAQPVDTSYRFVGSEVKQDETVTVEETQDVQPESFEETQDVQPEKFEETKNVQPESKTEQFHNATMENNTSSYREVPKKPHKKQRGMGFKIASLLLAAVLFGAVAGGVMVGVNYIGNKTINKQNTTVSSTADNLNNVLSASANNSSDLDINGIAKAVLPAMVELTGTVTVSSSSSSFGIYGGSQSYESNTSGTGIIVGENDTELLILTNAHVVSEVNNLNSVFVDGSSVACTVKGSRSDKDVAVVAVKKDDIDASTLSQISIAELGDSDGVEVGDHVIAIGNALGEGQAVTVGYISALNRSITVNNYTYGNLLMTDAAINAGNSGGALIDSTGRVIGINFAKTSSSASSSGVEGMAYSIPITSVRELIDSLMTTETREEVSSDKASYLGIGGQDITSSMASQYGYPTGLIITQVQSGSAAEKAGLAKYDIIVGFDNQSVTTLTGLKGIMKYYAAGETVNISYYHLDGNEYVLKNVDVTLGNANS